MTDKSLDPSSEPKPVAGSQKHGPKEPYERPRILSRERLESLAATCTENEAKASGICFGPPES
jgi:hypothetical protein